uniref:Tudor domain-containing protein n=1 Tax=Plectus sambesii TaxID=2011161 RepID=A0A914X778_9BILA
IEKQASVTVACRQECSIAPQPHASAFIPGLLHVPTIESGGVFLGAKLVFQDPHDKQYYRAILIKPKSDEGVSFKLFLMDVGRFEAFQPSQVREMPACVVDTDPLAMRVQLRRRPLQLAVDDHVVLVLATADAIPVVDVFRDYDDYIAAKENSERNNAHNSLNSLHQQDHPRRIEIGTQSREQDSRQIVDNGATRQGSSASERLDGKKGNQPSEGSKPNEVRVIQKVAQMEPTEREAIIRRAPSTILPTIVQSNEEGEHSITAATVRNGTDTPSNAVGTNNKLTSAAFVPIILPCNNSILKPIANGTIAAGEPTMTKLRVPPLTLSSGDSLLVHLEIESLVNDPHDFVLTKDCGSEFPLLLDDMNSRDKTPMMDVRVGDHCVFVDRSGRIVQYHRVEVVETNEATHTVKARRLDHGGALNDVHMNDLVDLAPDDVRMARVAIRCRLNSDYYNLADWDSSEVRQCLRKYALMTSCRQHLLLRAHVAAFDGGVATVQLHTRNDSSDVITEALCSARQRRTADQRVAANPSSTIFA